MALSPLQQRSRRNVSFLKYITSLFFLSFLINLHNFKVAFWPAELFHGIPRILNKDKIENNFNGTVYLCGHPFSRVAAALIPEAFNENRIFPLTVDNFQNLTSNDIVLFGMYGPCPVPAQKLSQNSVGAKILFMNGEPMDHKKLNISRLNNVYRIGPYPSSTSLGIMNNENSNNNAIQVYHAIHSVLGNITHNIRRLNDTKQKPVNTGEHFLLYVNSNCVSYREAAIRKLAQIGKVHAGGSCQGGMRSGGVGDGGYGIKRIFISRWDAKDKNKQLQKAIGSYRFYFAMENSNVDGYISEKIMNAFYGGAVPIYYGTKDIFKIFNKEAFIYYDIHNPEPALSRIAELESNRSAYEEVINQPILANGDETIRDFFSLRDDIGNGELKRKIREMIGI